MTKPRAKRRSAKEAKAPEPAATAATTMPPPIPLPSGGAHPGFGVGLWALGRWSREDETRTRATVDRALALGVPWFDTAEVYGAGRSERILGDALARRPAGSPGPFISTKVSWEHLKAPMVRAALHGSLQRLGRPSVDAYLVHAPDPRSPIPETMGALEALHGEGKIRAIGVSNFGPKEIEVAASALRNVPLAIDQVRFSLLERGEGDAVLEAARPRGIVVEAYTPLARGLLAGRYLDEEVPPAGVRNLARDLFDQDHFPEMRERARRLRTLAEREGVPMASLALHWLIRRGAVPVVGASRPEQVDALLAALAARPSDGALDRADAIGRGAGAD